MKKKLSSIDFDVIVGVDANATLPPSFEEVAGDFVLTPAKTHTARMAGVILSWLAALGVRALNTFPSEECIVNGALDERRLWTCGAKRKLSKRTQIDFLAVSPAVSGKSFPASLDGKVFSRSDHHAVMGNLQIVRKLSDDDEDLSEKTLNLKGWKPNSDEDM